MAEHSSSAGIAVTRALWSILSGQRQAARQLRLTFPNADAPARGLLVPHRLTADEGMSRDFRIELDLLSDRSDIPAADVLGKLVTIELARNDSSSRFFSGHAFEFGFVRNDAGHACYRLLLLPRLALLRHRSNHRLFHGLGVEAQTTLLLAEHGLQDWRSQTLGNDPPMTDACQFGESDYNYLHRRWEERGWHYRYEHRADGHTLVLCSDSYESPPIDGSGRIEWQGRQGVRRRGVQSFEVHRYVATTDYAISSHDFKRGRPRAASQPTLNRLEAVGTLEVHEYVGAYGFKTIDHGADLARLRIEEIEAAAERFVGEGDDDCCEAGRRFELADEQGTSLRTAVHGDREFVVIEACHEAQNSFEADSGASTPGNYHCRFIAQRRGVPWRPGRGFNSTTPRIGAPQTATVVGPAGESLHTDPYGRVRVQFHWDREGSFDARSSAWIRVATPWAGGELGWTSVPRVGTEVIVQWLDGNPDRPIITGAVHNQEHLPSWQLPAQKALTGLRSCELGGSRSNHLLLDDTPGRLQTQLRSDHLASQLSLGHVCRVDDNLGRKEARGQGFELRTDGHGALRAECGLLVTTSGRANAERHLSDAAESIEGLQRAGELQGDLGAAAMQGRGQDSGDQDAVAAALAAQAGTLAGTNGADPSTGRFPEFSQPHLALGSDAGVMAHARESAHLAADEHLALSSGRHTSLAAGKSLLASAKEAIRLFAYKAGIRLVAAGADVEIQALQRSVSILARLDIRQTANRITIAAKEELFVSGGGSYTRWSADGIVGGTDGAWQMKAASHRMEGPDNAPPPAIDPPEVALRERVAEGQLAFSVHPVPGMSSLLARQPYTLLKDGGEIGKGLLDDYGRLRVEKAEKGARYQVRLSNGTVFELPVAQEQLASDPGQPDYDEQRLSNKGYRSDGLDGEKRRSQRDREDE